MSEQKYFTLSCLKNRKWTPTAIKKFLGRPDKCDKNPYWSRGPSMKKFLVSRVENIEKSPEFQEWLRKNKNVRESKSHKQKEIAERKKKELFEYIYNLDIKIERLDKNELLDKVGSDGMSFEDVDNYRILRKCVSMLLKQFENCEKELEKIYGRRGIPAEVEIAFRHRILDEVMNVYPFLKEVCEVQKL